MKTHILKTAALLLPLAAAIPALAQMGNDQSPSAASSSDSAASAAASSSDNGSSVASADSEFAMKLATGSTNEIALSQLADSHSSSDDVKSFAQMMIHDHTQLNSQLSDLCAKKNVDISEAVQKGQRKGVSRLEKKNGADFDKAYLEMMVKGHKQTLALLKKEAADTKDQDFAQLATNALPTVQMHLDKAEQLQQNLNQ